MFPAVGGGGYDRIVPVRYQHASEEGKGMIEPVSFLGCVVGLGRQNLAHFVRIQYLRPDVPLCKFICQKVG